MEAMVARGLARVRETRHAWEYVDESLMREILHAALGQERSGPLGCVKEDLFPLERFGGREFEAIVEKHLATKPVDLAALWTEFDAMMANRGFVPMGGSEDLDMAKKRKGGGKPGGADDANGCH